MPIFNNYRPNAAVSFDGRDIVVRSLAATDGPADFSTPGGVTISYINLLDHWQARKERLKK